MELTTALAKFGLNQKQASIYLALLELGGSSVLEISRQAKIKRSTTYVVLDELQGLGLARYIKKGSTTVFEAAEPGTLGDQLQSRLKTFNQIKPLLDDIYLKEGAKPKVHYYSGLHEFIQLYQKMFKENRHIDFFGVSVEDFYNTVPRGIAEEFVQWLADGKSTAREIVTYDKTSIEWARKNNSQFHKIRIIEKEFAFASDNAIFGNTLLIASFEGPFAVTIESKEIIRTFRSMFEIAWKAAKHPRDIPKKAVLPPLQSELNII